MVTLDWSEMGWAAHPYMCSPSPTGGLFDLDETKCKPPDFQDLDPEFLSTLNLPRTSTDSLESDSDATNMIENWEMNEVFQDISSFLDTNIDNGHTNDNGQTADIDQFVNKLMDLDNVSCADSISLDVEPLSLLASTSVDLSLIIQETLGGEVLHTEFADAFHSENLKTELAEESGSNTIFNGFDLLEQLESLPAEEMHVDIKTPAESPTPSELTSVTAVENDHQYTQLASVKVKSHETKKQAIRRVKNNAASRVCRKQRKGRLVTNMETVGELTAKNTKLKSSILEIENIVSLLKDHLVKATKK